MNIHEFLQLPHQFRWGGVKGDDCMTFPATWAEMLTGVDPAAGLRGTYSTKIEADAILAGHGGALAFMGSKLRPLGWRRVIATSDGDIGLVRMPAGDRPQDVAVAEIGAVRFGPLWAAIGPAGIVAKPAEFIAAWRFPC